MLRKQKTQISQTRPKITLKIELRGKEDVELYTWFSIAITQWATNESLLHTAHQKSLSSPLRVQAPLSPTSSSMHLVFQVT